MIYDLSKPEQVKKINQLPLQEFERSLNNMINIHEPLIFIEISNLIKLKLLAKKGLHFSEKNFHTYYHCQSEKYLKFLLDNGVSFYHSDPNNSPYYFITDFSFFKEFYSTVKIHDAHQHMFLTLHGHLRENNKFHYYQFLQKCEFTKFIHKMSDTELQKLVSACFIKANWQGLLYLFSRGCGIFYSSGIDLFEKAKSICRSHISIEKGRIQRNVNHNQARLYKFHYILSQLDSWGKNIDEVHARLTMNMKKNIQNHINGYLSQSDNKHQRL